jgi:hypothetical protein
VALRPRFSPGVPLSMVWCDGERVTIGSGTASVKNAGIAQAQDEHRF